MICLPVNSSFLYKLVICAEDLLMQETTKEITIPFVFEGSADAAIFKGSFTIKRSDFNIGNVDDEIGDEVTIYLEIPVSKIN